MGIKRTGDSANCKYPQIFLITEVHSLGIEKSFLVRD